MIQIIFDEEKDRREGYIDCCHIIIDDHGIKQQKVIRTETLYELLEKTKNFFLEECHEDILQQNRELRIFPKSKVKLPFS